MALTVETGSNILGANSYVTDAEFLEYAAARGVIIPVDAAAREVLLIKAMDYIESYDSRFQGQRAYGYDQPLSWPRGLVYFNGYLWDYSVIPEPLKKAQMVLAITAQTIELLPNTAASTGGAISRKTVGPITIEYANGSGESSASAPTVPLAVSLLRPLLGGGRQLKVVRA